MECAAAHLRLPQQLWVLGVLDLGISLARDMQCGLGPAEGIGERSHVAARRSLGSPPQRRPVGRGLRLVLMKLGCLGFQTTAPHLKGSKGAQAKRRG